MLDYATHHPEGLAGVLRGPPLGELGVPTGYHDPWPDAIRIFPVFPQVGMDLSGLARDPSGYGSRARGPLIPRGTAGLHRGDRRIAGSGRAGEFCSPSDPTRIR